PCLQLFQEPWPHLVTQGMYCLSTSGVWEPSPSDQSLLHSPATLSSGPQQPEGTECQLELPPENSCPHPQQPPDFAHTLAPSLGQDLEAASPRQEVEGPLGRKVSDARSSGVQSFEEGEEVAEGGGEGVKEG
ncbi:protein FAM131B-like, partial [Cetorhinus maximus]